MPDDSTISTEFLARVANQRLPNAAAIASFFAGNGEALIAWFNSRVAKQGAWKSKAISKTETAPPAPAPSGTTRPSCWAAVGPVQGRRQRAR